uniref:Uncharacterized protein AlNc14C364G11028 n=1 Tax=Albugo laibachii Nc14 TaxID=890382 RepID=F0WXU1_9STRA|nr:conserved hypothetical protein [Albugo laibachii Nc14]|eukprot:CCA26289.1 conserved hypothetical protein [Albugo laibachii Nc14]
MQTEPLPSDITGTTSSSEIVNTSVVSSTIPSLKRSFTGTTSGISQLSQRAPTQSQAINSLAILSHHAAKQNQIGATFPSNKTTASPPSMFRSISTSGIYSCATNGTNYSQTYAPKICNSARSTQPPPTVLNTNSSSTPNGLFPTNSRCFTASSSAPPIPAAQDWRTYLTIEERQAVRTKIRDGYMNRCSSSEDLLQVACAIEEELLHASAPSRLDYFKGGYEFDSRVKLKREQLKVIQTTTEPKRRRKSLGEGVECSSGYSSHKKGEST